MRTLENHQVFPRQLLVRVVNDLLIQRIFYKRYVQWSTILTSALLKTTEFLLTITRARIKWPPDTKCQSVSQFSKKGQFSEVKSSQAHFQNQLSFLLAIIRARKIERVPSFTNCVEIPSLIASKFPHAKKSIYVSVSQVVVKKHNISSAEFTDENNYPHKFINHINSLAP